MKFLRKFFEKTEEIVEEPISIKIMYEVVTGNRETYLRGTSIPYGDRSTVRYEPGSVSIPRSEPSEIVQVRKLPVFKVVD